MQVFEKFLYSELMIYLLIMYLDQVINQKPTPKLPVHKKFNSTPSTPSKNSQFINSQYQLHGSARGNIPENKGPLMITANKYNKQTLKQMEIQQKQQLLNIIRNKYMNISCTQNTDDDKKTRKDYQQSKLSKFLKNCNNRKFNSKDRIQLQKIYGQGLENNQLTQAMKLGDATVQQNNQFNLYHLNINNGKIEQKIPVKILAENNTKARILQQESEEDMDLCINKILGQPENMYLPLSIHEKMNRGKHCQSTKAAQRKSEIKQKIKDRIKNQISDLIKKNTFRQNPQSQQKIQKKICFRPDTLNEKTLIKNWAQFQKHEKELAKFNIYSKQSARSSSRKKSRQSILLSGLPIPQRKIKSSFDNRAKNTINQQIKQSNHGYQAKLEEPKYQHNRAHTPYYNYQNYRRSMSTDIRSRNCRNFRTSSNANKKNSIAQPLKLRKNDQQIEPWVIKNGDEDYDQNF